METNMKKLLLLSGIILSFSLTAMEPILQKLQDKVRKKKESVIEKRNKENTGLKNS